MVWLRVLVKGTRFVNRKCPAPEMDYFSRLLTFTIPIPFVGLRWSRLNKELQQKWPTCIFFTCKSLDRPSTLPNDKFRSSSADEANVDEEDSLESSSRSWNRFGKFFCTIRLASSFICLNRSVSFLAGFNYQNKLVRNAPDSVFRTKL